MAITRPVLFAAQEELLNKLCSLLLLLMSGRQVFSAPVIAYGLDLRSLIRLCPVRALEPETIELTQITISIFD